MNAAQQENLAKFKSLAESKIFIRVIYDILPGGSRKTYSLFTTIGLEPKVYWIRITISQISSTFMSYILEHLEISEIDDYGLHSMLGQFSGNSELDLKPDEDPFFSQFNAISLSRSGKSRMTRLNFIVDLIEILHLISGELINGSRVSRDQKIACRTFINRLVGFLDEYIRETTNAMTRLSQL